MEIDGATEVRLTKRQKLSNGQPSQTQRKPGASRLFAPYRTLGLVSPTTVPFTSVPLGKTTFQITTSVGRSLQTYDLRKGLNLVFITRPQTPELITATKAWKDKVITAYGGDGAEAESGVWVLKRGKKEAELEMPKGGLQENIKSFCVFGSWIVGVRDSQLLVWKAATYELYTATQSLSPVSFTSCIASLPTYLNKIIVGRQDGSAEIWNVSTGKLVYTILPPSSSYGAVTALEPTPALSLVAIAYEKGPIIIHDIRTDQTVIALAASASVPTTSITFRTDGLGASEDGQKAGIMATASTATGDIVLWDLNNGGRKAGTLRAAHAHPATTSPGGVSKIEFLSGQAVLVSSGLDNSLKTWIFDQTPFSPLPRILHERRGHGAPVTRLHFLPSASDGSDDTGKWLLSASRDRSLWGWSLRRDGQSTELSQGNVQSKAKKQGLLSGDREKFEELKCPPITAVACELNRDGGIGALPGKQPIWQSHSGSKKGKVDAEVAAMTGWESVVTAHENDRKARTWFWGRKRAGRWALPTSDEGNVSSVAMSPCGTFALVGSEKGGIDMFNLQSGMHRQRFPARLTPVQAKQLKLDLEKHGLAEEDDGKKKYYRGQGRHTASVVGLAVDSLNRTVVSASSDGKMKFWSFATGLLEHEINWSMQTGITAMRFHRSASLAALACTDGFVRVVDIETRKLVRELWPSRTPLAQLAGQTFSDFCFSSDGHWIAACMGQIVLLWDLPTGHLVDAFKVRAECKSLAFSPTGEFLATATTEGVGVDIWSNRTLFSQVSTRHIGEAELARIINSEEAQAPTVSGEGGSNPIADAEDEAADESTTEDTWLDDSINQLSSDLLSLSLVPRSRWQNLLHLDLIRQRNKPIEPPKKPAKAPFFLPSLQDRQAVPSLRNTTAGDAADVEKERSRISRLQQQGQRSSFSTLLQDAVASGDYWPFVENLKGLSPAAADIEIRSLSLERSEHLAFVRALTWLIHERRDFELGQAWMAVFLRIHGDVVVSDGEVRRAVEEWQDALDVERKRVQRLAGYAGGVVGYLRAVRV